MTVIDVLGANKKHNVMQDTWGHLYPQPGSKIPCKILVMSHDSQQTVYDRKNDAQCSPIEFELVCTILDAFDWSTVDDGLYEVDCVLWFYKTCNDAYRGQDIGRLIKIKPKLLHSTGGWGD